MIWPLIMFYWAVCGVTVCLATDVENGFEVLVSFIFGGILVPAKLLHKVTSR